MSKISHVFLFNSIFKNVLVHPLFMQPARSSRRSVNALGLCKVMVVPLAEPHAWHDEI